MRDLTWELWLGLCLEEIARLTDEREFHRRHVVEMKDVLRRGGWVECDIPACNCGSWHHRYGLPERWREICDELIDAGMLGNSTGHKPLRAIQLLRTRLAEAESQLRAVALKP